MNFEEYLKSKKIDSAAFLAAEPAVWESWRLEFDHVSPTSFTAQKLYLINPIRRKYHLPEPVTLSPASPSSPSPAQSAPAVKDQSLTPPGSAKPAVPRPVFKPKPKMN